MRRTLHLALLFSVLGPLACHPKRPVQTAPQKTNTPLPEATHGVVKGILRQIGNAPHIEVVVTGESEAFGKGDYRLIGKKASEISALPLGPIAVKGQIRRLDMRLAGNSGRTRKWLDIDASSYIR